MKPEEDRGDLFAGHAVLRSESAVAAAEDDAVGGRLFDAVGVPFARGNIREDSGARQSVPASGGSAGVDTLRHGMV